MKHIIFDARALQEQVDGIGRYSLGVMGAMLRLKPEWKFSVIACPGGIPHLEKLPLNIIESRVPRFRPGEDRKLSPLIESSGADCYLNFSMAGPLPNVPTVLAVHDLMVLTVPGYFGEGLLRNLLGRILFRRRLRRSVAHAAAIPVLSTASLEELLSVFPGAGGKAFTAGAGQDLFTEPSARPYMDRTGNFLLYVGNARAYKNVTRLLVAYSRLKAMNRDFPELKMVVRRDRAFDSFALEVEDSSARDHISVVSQVPDRELRELYRECLFLVIPSIKEGFGLPALEAMAAGTPVLASRDTALSELTGEAAMLVDPMSVKDIMYGMAKLAADPQLRERLAERALERALTFTWRRTARKIADRIEELTD